MLLNIGKKKRDTMKVKGTKYAAADEKYDKKMKKKDNKDMKRAGIAVAFKDAKKEKGYSKMPKLKGQKKVRSIKDKKGSVI